MTFGGSWADATAKRDKKTGTRKRVSICRGFEFLLLGRFVKVSQGIKSRPYDAKVPIVVYTVLQDAYPFLQGFYFTIKTRLSCSNVLHPK